jgi:SAM-dependent methyltransferase
MEGYRPETYGDRIADVYDAMMADLPDPTDSVDRLADLAGPGPALELGIGTGRVALPLAARGVQVHGVDASEAMVGRLRAKPGGEAIPVTLGDFAGVPAEGDYRLVYVVFNTFFALLTQDAQVRCFAGVARRLAPGGAFVLQDFQHVVLAEGGVRLHPGAIRYAWPSELDLMARLAGLRLRERWGGWRREPFGADSPLHVSVYEHAEGAAS